MQLNFIFKSFNKEDYFDNSNSKRIKIIALIVFLWAVADNLIHILPGIVIPNDFIQTSHGLISFEKGITKGIMNLNFKLVIISILIYALSIVFKYGNELKEETSLTI